MDWINFHTSVLDSAEFMTSEPVDRGTWLCLQRYCCGQENSGRILGAAKWTDRIWQQLTGVTLKEIKRSSPLWTWEGDDLLVSFYNLESERKVQRLRGQASAAGHASWSKRGSPTVEPHGSSDGTAKGKESKGKESKVQEIPPNPQGGTNQGDPKPSRSRAPKAGSVLPAEQSEDLSQRMIAVGAIKGRGPGSPWSARELEALRSARLHDCSAADFEDQLALMLGYYRAKIPREMDYRRRDLQTLLNNWSSELDRARAYKRDHNDGVVKP